MRDTRKARKARQAAQASRPVETRTERSLRRTSAARRLAAEAADARGQGPVRRAAPKPSVYQRASRAATVTAAASTVMMLVLGFEGPGHDAEMGAFVARTAAPLMMDTPQISAASVAGALSPRVNAAAAMELAAAAPADLPPVLAPAPPAASSMRSSVSAPARQAGSGGAHRLPLIEILPPEPAPHVALSARAAARMSLRPMQRPVRAERTVQADVPTARTCSFGAIVQRGDTVFHRPPTCS